MKALFDFADQSALGVWMRESSYSFPVFEMIHLTGLGLLLGAMLLFNLRFFGIGLGRISLSEVARDLAPWTRIGLIVMVLSGIPLFCAKAGELWGDDRTNFTIKMSLIAFSVVFYYFVQRPLASKESVWTGRLAAIVSLASWLGAALAGLSLEFI